ncbi:hypothetical protein I6A60_27930 [Frankia sp. AgB1.9]|uniref:hypothetical protein n=1 Tax=unclassified Frankia TaxID=2632575 RepID=UPI001933813B|nr:MULTISPECIES: hypothetical protein [unclassified Frankia]MBL7488194.1 hypothetical protein [Frankia sp. AgW1.1]MBL7551661.1 hypothetical protein [Frankia sp. AgB1.9]MBL7620197.1 hypothetical protein [Frankia sp. AgB1.8]
MTALALCGCNNPADGWENWSGVGIAVNARMYALKIGQPQLAAKAKVPLEALRAAQSGQGPRKLSNAQLGAISAALDFPADYLTRLLAREIAGDSKAEARAEVDPTPPVLVGLPEARRPGDGEAWEAGADAEWPSVMASGLVVLVRPRPGDSPAEVVRLLTAVPSMLAFVTALGDERPVLVFGPADDPPSEREVLRAVVSTMNNGQ